MIKPESEDPPRVNETFFFFIMSVLQGTIWELGRRKTDIYMWYWGEEYLVLFAKERYSFGKNVQVAVCLKTKAHDAENFLPLCLYANDKYSI